MATCYCDPYGGQPHPFDRQFCGRFPKSGDPNSPIEREREKRRREADAEKVKPPG